MTVQPSNPAGWYPDGRVQRYWDGTRWTGDVVPITQPVAHLTPVVVNVGQPGGPKAVSGLSTGMKIAHLVMTICTLGLWAPVWWLHGRLSRHKVIY